MRQQADPVGALGVPTLSSSVAATLRVIDVSSWRELSSIDFVCSCVKLRLRLVPVLGLLLPRLPRVNHFGLHLRVAPLHGDDRRHHVRQAGDRLVKGGLQRPLVFHL
ncbi:hypothetical protein FOA52_009846 [Chlamydomonas sp. UWO 241]|nr:hypothetical protein FOA52_009846 [Chlamydomonas sp. UWO 241]